LGLKIQKYKIKIYFKRAQKKLDEATRNCERLECEADLLKNK